MGERLSDNATNLCLLHKDWKVAKKRQGRSAQKPVVRRGMCQFVAHECKVGQDCACMSEPLLKIEASRLNGHGCETRKAPMACRHQARGPGGLHFFIPVCLCFSREYALTGSANYPPLTFYHTLQAALYSKCACLLWWSGQSGFLAHTNLGATRRRQGH